MQGLTSVRRIGCNVRRRKRGRKPTRLQRQQRLRTEEQGRTDPVNYPLTLIRLGLSHAVHVTCIAGRVGRVPVGAGQAGFVFTGGSAREGAEAAAASNADDPSEAQWQRRKTPSKRLAQQRSPIMSKHQLDRKGKLPAMEGFCGATVSCRPSEGGAWAAPPTMGAMVAVIGGSVVDATGVSSTGAVDTEVSMRASYWQRKEIRIPSTRG